MAIDHFGKYHNTIWFCFLLGPLFLFSLGTIVKSPEKLETMLMQNLGDKQRVLWYFLDRPKPPTTRTAARDAVNRFQTM